MIASIIGRIITRPTPQEVVLMLKFEVWEIGQNIPAHLEKYTIIIVSLKFLVSVPNPFKILLFGTYSRFPIKKIIL